VHESVCRLLFPKQLHSLGCRTVLSSSMPSKLRSR
jgi:hypothetical protein